jgi:hypothetical protein
MPTPERLKLVQVDTKLLAAEKAQMIALHKSTQYLTFENIPFKNGAKNPLVPKLKALQKHKPNSIPGKVLIELYRQIQDKLDDEHPIVKRVFIGEMLKRLKVKGAPGMVPFMKLVLKETGDMQPLLIKHIKQLIMLVESMPDSPYKRKIIKELFGYGGIKKSNGRPEDPLFGENSDSREGGPLDDYGVLESVDTFDPSAEVMDQTKLDPFQLILYKRLIQGHKKFAQTILKQMKPLFKFHGWRYVKKAVYKAIYDFADWVKVTVEKMSIANAAKLPAIYQAQIQAFKLPSLPKNIPVPAPWWVKIFPIEKVDKAKKQLSNVRGRVEQKIKKELGAGLETIKTLSIFGPLLQKELARKKMFRNAHNRTFLNRFWTLAYRKFKSSSGDERMQYEFFTMVLDSIKDDAELVQIKKRIMPFLIAVLKFSPDAQKLSQRYFGKNFNSLSAAEIKEVVDLLLPSGTLTLRQRQSKEYKDILGYMKLILDFKIGIAKIKQKNYPVYVAITTVAHNLISIYTSLTNERDARKAKKKIAEFVRGFQTIKKLIGKEGMQAVQAKSSGFAKVLKQPQLIINRLKGHVMCPPAVKAALTEFERRHKLKQPEVAKSAMRRVEKIERELLKLEKKYAAMRDAKFKKGIIDYKILAKLKSIRKDMRKIQAVINFLVEVTDEKSFNALLDLSIVNNLYSTRYLKVTPQTQKQMSFAAVERAKRLKPDYNNLFYVSKVVSGYVKRTVKDVYQRSRFGYTFTRIQDVLDDIVLTYGYHKQKELGAKGAYEFLKDPENRKAFVAEIVRRVNGFLKTAKMNDKNDKIIQIRPITGQFARHIERYIVSNILPKARKARPA